MSAAKPPSQLRRNLTICTGEGLLSMPWVIFSMPASFLMAALLTQVLHLDKKAYGVVASMLAWSNAAQILFSPMLAGRFPAKHIALGFCWVNWALWLALIPVLSYIPVNDAVFVARFFIVFFGLTSLLNAIGSGVGWTSWIQEWIPARLRGKYFGRRNRVLSIVTIGFLLLAGEVIKWVGNSVRAYQLVFGLAVLMRLGSLTWQIWLINSHKMEEKPAGWRSYAQIAEVFQNKPFMRFMVLIAFTGFWFNLTSPFVPVFLYEYLKMPVEQANFLVIISTFSGALSTPMWGRMCDRYGCKFVIVLSVLTWEGQNYLWCFLTPGIADILYFMWFWGGFTATGFFLGAFNLLLKLINPKTKTTSISVHMAVTSVAAAVAPILAGHILAWTEAAGIPFHQVFRAGMFLRITCVIGSLLLLKKIVEPDAARLDSALGALRTVRQTMSIQGVVNAANYTVIAYRPSALFKRKKPAKKPVPKDHPPG